MSKEGRHLLSSLETSGKEDDSQWDVKLDWETVQRYDIFKQPFLSCQLLRGVLESQIVM